LEATTFLELVTCDISVYVNTPSREGYRYTLVFTDVATKEFWAYGLKNRTGDEVLACLKNLVEVKLRQYPGEHRLQHYHADGGAELLDKKIREYLTEKFATKITFSSTDTPELNAVSERKFRTLGEMTLAMLADSGLPTNFWWDAYVCACYVARLMPTRTYKGWMSPAECVPGGVTPSLSRLRRWGCKAYVLKPRADRRKDWDDKALIGYFMGYSTEKAGYQVFLPADSKVVTSVHVLFDEAIPERGDDYFKEFDEATSVNVDPEAQKLEDFQHLVGKPHMDEGLLYKTTRVVVRKGFIIAFRSLVTAGREQIEDKTPIHVADVKLMTEQIERRLDKDYGLRDAKDHGSSDAGTGGTPDEMSAIITPAVEYTENPPDRRRRTPRLVTNISTLGEIHHLDERRNSLLDDADAVFMTDDLPPEPVSHAESLRGPECKYWKRARRNERHALEKRRVMDVCKTPPGVKPLKSKYVYKRKRDKVGKIKKFKARLVIMGCGEEPGPDIPNTFAPVVKSVTVRLLLAIAFLFCMFVHQLDVTNAFCYADVEGDVYMSPTPDFDLPDGYCFKLLKSLYGLRSSPRSWWKNLNSHIKSMGFKQCVLDSCLYYRWQNGELCLITIYVDDILVACANIETVRAVKKQFCDKYDMTDLGELEHFLNVRVTRTEKEMVLDQAVYTQKMIDTYARLLGKSGRTRKQPLPADAADKLADKSCPEDQTD
jgi:hypothetical protein